METDGADAARVKQETAQIDAVLVLVLVVTVDSVPHLDIHEGYRGSVLLERLPGFFSTGDLSIIVMFVVLLALIQCE